MLKSRPFVLVDCDCIDCRRSAGAPYVQWGSVPREDLALTKREPRNIVYANRTHRLPCAVALICFLKTAKTRTTSTSRLRRSTIRHRFRRRNRSSSKMNGPGLSQWVGSVFPENAEDFLSKARSQRQRLQTNRIHVHSYRFVVKIIPCKKSLHFCGSIIRLRKQPGSMSPFSRIQRSNI